MSSRGEGRDRAEDKGAPAAGAEPVVAEGGGRVLVVSGSEVSRGLRIRALVESPEEEGEEEEDDDDGLDEPVAATGAPEEKRGGLDEEGEKEEEGDGDGGMVRPVLFDPEFPVGSCAVVGAQAQGFRLLQPGGFSTGSLHWRPEWMALARRA